MSTKRDDFMEDWRENITKLIPDLTDEEIENTGNHLWMGREIMYGVVEDDSFDLLMHRYFHGVASIRLNLLMIAAQGMPSAILLAEQMFALGFVCGKADERGWDVDSVASVEESVECVQARPAMLPTREELEQADSLPIALVTVDDALAEDFGGTPPPDIPPDIDIEEGGAYF